MQIGFFIGTDVEIFSITPLVHSCPLQWMGAVRMSQTQKHHASPSRNLLWNEKLRVCKVMLLSAVRTLILTAPNHCRGSIDDVFSLKSSFVISGIMYRLCSYLLQSVHTIPLSWVILAINVQLTVHVLHAMCFWFNVVCACVPAMFACLCVCVCLPCL